MDTLYNLIIVDDEYIIREGLLHFKWERFGFSVIGSASDGKEALELMENNQVHLVITDIKMPIMGGLELCEIIQEKYPLTKVIILTGYKEFEYAQHAIRTGVAEYLLKPVELSAIEDLVKKIKQDIDKNICKDRQLRESLPLAKENFIRNLVNRLATDLIELEEKSNNLEIYLSHQYFTCSVFQIEFEHSSFNEHQRIYLNQLFKQSIHTFLLSANSIYFYFDSDFRLVLIYNFNIPNDSVSTYRYIEDMVEQVHSLIKNCFRDNDTFSVYAGSGNIYNSVTYLSTTYKQAIQALGLRFFNDKTELFYAWKEKSIYTNCENYYPYEKEQVLINIVLAGKDELIPQSLSDFWLDLKNSLKQINPQHFKSIVIQLLNMLERNLQKFNIHLSELIPSTLYYSEYIASLSTVTSVRNEVENLFIKATLYISQLHNCAKSSSHQAVNEAIKYIEENYTDKITLTEAADKVFLNASYLSLQFKKETGMNFVDYIKKVRIEKAMELLKRIDLKAYEICNCVGYQDYKYFTEVFKDFTGLSPLEYRQKIS